MTPTETIGEARLLVKRGRLSAYDVTCAQEYLERLCDECERLQQELEDSDLLAKFLAEKPLVADKLVSLALAKMENAQHWKPVGEGLPKDNEPVYAYCPTNNKSVESTTGMMVRAHKYSGYTHWMPRIVPQPPKGEE